MSSETETEKQAREARGKKRASRRSENPKGAPQKERASRAEKPERRGEPLQVILVPGMHRSGTSAVTRVLNLLGAALPGNLMPPVPDNNESGFWESLTLMDLHDELLEDLASSWDDPTPFPERWLDSSPARRYEKKIIRFLNSEFPDSSLCVIKDPRACRFLGLWISAIRKAGAEPVAVIPYRHPVEVAWSLKGRDTLPAAQSYLMWLRHVLLAERDTRAMTRTFVDYGRFLDDWLTATNRMARQLDIAWPCNVLKANNDIDAFLQRRQRHHVEAPGDLDARDDVPEWVKRIYKALPRLEADPADAGAMREFDRVRKELSRGDATFSPVLRAYRDADAELKKTRESLEAELSDQKMKLSGLRETLELTTADVRRLESGLTATSTELETTKAELETTKAELETTKAELDETTRRADRMDRRQRDLGRVIAHLTAGDGRRGETAATNTGPEPSGAGRASLSSRVLGQLVRRFGGSRAEEKIRMRALRRRLIGSGLFDCAYYEKSNPDVVQHRVDPVRHFIEYGAAEGRFPNPLFDPRFYAGQVSPADLIDLDPLLHFIEHGARKGLNPHPLFDLGYYLENNPDVASAGINPLAHYLGFGWKERRRPSIYFDCDYYEAQLSVPLEKAGNPLAHYLETGAKEGLDPHPLFSTGHYFANSRDLWEAGINPLVHYLEAGASEGRDPHPLFDIRFYLSQFRDEIEHPVEPLRHYLEIGALCGLDPNPCFDSAFYLSQDEKLVRGRINPLVHYLRHGAREQRATSRSFNTALYLKTHPGVAESGVNPLAHFISHGFAEGRKAPHVSPQVDQRTHAERPVASGSAVLRERELFQVLEMPVPPEIQLDPLMAAATRLVAFYLPQFHPIPENDQWWGPGFTEWTNVVRGHSFISGALQPRLPGALGFYDLRLPEVREKQAELARSHGIDAFCYHYYWFNGKKLLSRPLDEVLATGRPDFPFCICWANENWTRRWDGLDDEILLSQTHSLESDRDFIRHVIPILEDRRYLRVDGRPILLVYRPDLFQNPAETAGLWREECLRAGIGDIHLCAVQFQTTDPRPLGFDAAGEFPPHRLKARNITNGLARHLSAFQGRVFDLTSAIRTVLESNPRPDYPLYRGVMPGWNNIPRRLNHGTVYAGGTPAHYAAWLRDAINFRQSEGAGRDNLVLINAWNEWAEGAMLEPNQAEKDAYLQATLSAIDPTVSISDIIRRQGAEPGRPRRAADV